MVHMDVLESIHSSKADSVAWSEQPTATPLADFVRWYKQPFPVGAAFDCLFMTPATYEQLRQAALVGSIRHLPTRQRYRLLARVRAGRGALAKV
jgi:hypothetical protein